MKTTIDKKEDKFYNKNIGAFMYNDEEFLNFYNSTKTDFERLTQELEKMIEETVGKSENYYRISQMLRLVEIDFKRVLEATGELAEAIKDNLEMEKELMKQQEKLKDYMKQAGMQTEFSINPNVDIVSEIVKNVNSLDEQSQKRLLAYTAGMASGASSVHNDKKISNIKKLSKKY